MRNVQLIALVLLMIGSLVGCAPNANTSMESKPAAKVEKIEHSLLKVGEAVPSLEAKMLDGTTFNIADHKGKVVVLDFWGLWCPSCVEMLPEIREAAHEYEGKGVEVIGVNTDELSTEELSEKLKKADITWPQITLGTIDSPVVEAWKVDLFPTVYVVDQEGRVAAVDPENLKAAIQKLL
ncbi:MAG: redoxin domain-containing protein [Fimbriimonadaceae bacterium]|nr:MAG: redoxin domain-containing protein [Fimbriimonadaceae bacterium]